MEISTKKFGPKKGFNFNSMPGMVSVPVICGQLMPAYEAGSQPFDWRCDVRGFLTAHMASATVTEPAGRNEAAH